MAKSQTLANLSQEELFRALMEIARNLTPAQARQFSRYAETARWEE